MASNFEELDRIVLTLIQSIALLLPVVFLTFRHYLKGADRDIPQSKLLRRLRLVIAMVSLLTVSGFFATLGLLDISFKPVFTLIAVLSLAFFFLIYGLFIYKITKWGQIASP